MSYTVIEWGQVLVLCCIHHFILIWLLQFQAILVPDTDQFWFQAHSDSSPTLIFQTHSGSWTHSRSMLYRLSNNTLIICSIQLNCFACVSSRYQAIFHCGLGMRLVVRLSSQLVLLQHTGRSSSSVSSNWKTNKWELRQPNTSSRLGWNFRSGFLFEFYLAFFPRPQN